MRNLGYLAGGLVGLMGLAGAVSDEPAQITEESQKVDWRSAIPEENAFWRVAFTDKAIADLDSGRVSENDIFMGMKDEIADRMPEYYKGLEKFSVYDSDSNVKMITPEEFENPEFKRTIDDWVAGTEFEKEDYDVLYFSQGTQRTEEQALEAGIRRILGSDVLDEELKEKTLDEIHKEVLSEYGEVTRSYMDCSACRYSVSGLATRAYELDRALDDLKVGSGYFVVGPLVHPLGAEGVYKSLFARNGTGVPQIGVAVNTDDGWEVIQESVSNKVQKFEPSQVRKWIEEARGN